MSPVPLSEDELLLRDMQRVFVRVVNHLGKQRKKAWDDVAKICRLRTTDGLRCAVGCLIKHKTYRKEFENFHIGQLLYKGGLSQMMLGRTLTEDDYEEVDAWTKLLFELQLVHDGSEPKEWPKQLVALGEAFEFNTTCVDKAFKKKS